jgi:Pretoxin HINT domain
MYQNGGQFYQACLHDAFNPNFMTNRALDMLYAYAKVLEGGSIIMGSAVLLGVIAFFCNAVCGAAMLVLSPELAFGAGLFDIWAITGMGALGGAFIGDAIADTVAEEALASATENAIIQNEAQVAELARLAEWLRNPTCEANSFDAGTRVLLADGSTRPIEQIRAGDTVLAGNTTTGSTRPERVTDTITGRGAKSLVNVAVGGGAVTATANHPFWAPALHEWTSAAGLTRGGWLQTSVGTKVQISAATRPRTVQRTVYNLTVAKLHTFYVMAGKTAILVHNAGCDAISLGKEETEDNPMELLEFSVDVQAPMYRNWPESTDKWYVRVVKFLEHGTTRIHMNLNGIEDPVAYAKSGASVNPATGTQGMTRWEMYQIQQHPQAWDRVTFYRKER